MRQNVIQVIFMIFLGIFLSNTSLLSIDPYMDEVFHIPQAAKYCSGNFSHWDPKITTLPGLYLWTTLLHKILRVHATITTIRLSNTVLPVMLLYLLSRLRSSIVNKGSRIDTTEQMYPCLVPLLIAFFPLISFYYFMYYTDTLSLLMLVWLFTALSSFNSEKKLIRHTNSSLRLLLTFLVASFAIVVRQTNALWVLFSLGTEVLFVLSEYTNFSDNEFSANSILNLISLVATHWRKIVQYLWPLWLPLLGFAVFVQLNGGIVVGDKSNHVAILHLAMPLHALVTAGIAMFPVLACDGLRLVATLRKCRQRQRWTIVNIILTRVPFHPLPTLQKLVGDSDRSDNMSQDSTLVKDALRDITDDSSCVYMALCFHTLGCSAVVCALAFSSHSHPFLLADNRHYMFYLWRRFLKYTIVRALLGIPYYIIIVTVVTRLRQVRGPVWILGFIAATALSLSPTPLLEPRYFSPVVAIVLLNWPEIPSFIQRNDNKIHINQDYLLLSISATLCLICTCISLYIYLYKPFVWHDGTKARFMF